MIFIFLFLSSSPKHLWAADLLVAVSSNFKNAFEDIKTVYEKDMGFTIEAVYASSGKLTTQIQHGAPFDIFLSADWEFPQELYQKGFALQTPEIYAQGVLVFWSMNGLEIEKGIEVLRESKVNKIALADPKAAPYGKAAMEALNYYDLYQKLKSNLVYGENISQTNQFISIKAVDGGFTSLSTVMSKEMRGQGEWFIIDPKAYSTLEQAGVILKHAEGKRIDMARKLMSLILSNRGQMIIKEHGYLEVNQKHE